jgi:hypothetical protein
MTVVLYSQEVYGLLVVDTPCTNIAVSVSVTLSPYCEQLSIS